MFSALVLLVILAITIQIIGPIITSALPMLVTATVIFLIVVFVTSRSRW